ncbi:MAG: adenylyl-sulfate kinase [Actinomycetales bacterium]
MTDWTALFDSPVHALDGGSLDGLELLAGGLFAPADGYCLPGRMPPGWPAEFTLGVPANTAQRAADSGSLLLSDPDGTPLARLRVSEVDSTGAGLSYLAGSLEAIQPAEHPPARALRQTTPLRRHAAASGSTVFAAAFSAVPRPEQMAEAVFTAQSSTSDLLLLAVVDSGETHTPIVSELLESLQACAAPVKGAYVRLLVVPGTDDGPERAVVLRRAAIDGLRADSVRDFGPGLPSRAAIVPAAQAAPSARHGRGMVVLFTGLSGSGKSTLARQLLERLRREDPRPATLLDGDDVRRLLSAGLGFSRQDRELNVRRLGWVASLVAGAGGIAVCAPIAPFESMRRESRDMAESRGGGFFLVHVSTPLEVCEQRDRKGLYAKARAGLLPDFTGIDSPYESPAAADYAIDTAVLTVDQGVDEIMGMIRARH